jgi:hypothetical protein
VLKLLPEGDSYKTCADKMAVSIDTVRFYVGLFMTGCTYIRAVKP